MSEPERYAVQRRPGSLWRVVDTLTGRILAEHESYRAAEEDAAERNKP